MVHARGACHLQQPLARKTSPQERSRQHPCTFGHDCFAGTTEETRAGVGGLCARLRVPLARDDVGQERVRAFIAAIDASTGPARHKAASNGVLRRRGRSQLRLHRAVTVAMSSVCGVRASSSRTTGISSTRHPPMVRRLLRARKLRGLLGGLGKQIRSAHLYVRAPSPLLQRASLSTRMSSP